jgi:hypothetical protein
MLPQPRASFDTPPREKVRGVNAFAGRGFEGNRHLGHIEDATAPCGAEGIAAAAVNATQGFEGGDSRRSVDAKELVASRRQRANAHGLQRPPLSAGHPAPEFCHFHLPRAYVGGTAAVLALVALSMVFYAYWSVPFLLLLLVQMTTVCIKIASSSSSTEPTSCQTQRSMPSSSRPRWKSA